MTLSLLYDALGVWREIQLLLFWMSTQRARVERFLSRFLKGQYHQFLETVCEEPKNASISLEV